MMISTSLLLLLSLLLSIIIICNSHTDNIHINHNNIAIGIQGKVSSLNEWINVYRLMKKHNNNISLFLLSYDNILYNCDNDIICIYKPNSTWTSGRNNLLISIYNNEEIIGSIYKYILFADSDMLYVNCDEMSLSFNKDEGAAFCLNRFIQMYLLSSISFAQVSFLGKLSRPNEFYKFDCPDAKFVAFHHAAVPILLPYVEKLDNMSWWESQRILWRVASGCIPFSSIGSGMLGDENIINEHASYPKTQSTERLSQVIKDVYGKLGLTPNPIDDSQFNTVQGDCANQENMILNRQNRPPNSIPNYYTNTNNKYRRLQFDNATIELSEKWRNTNEYHYCLSKLKVRYHQYVKNRILD